MRGFLVSNLWYMRQLYLEYHGDENLQPLVGEVSWSHNRVLVTSCKAPPTTRALIGRVEGFLRAICVVFAFVGSQRGRRGALNERFIAPVIEL